MGSETRSGRLYNAETWFCAFGCGAHHPLDVRACHLCGTLRPAPPEAVGDSPSWNPPQVDELRARNWQRINDPRGWRARVEGLRKPPPPDEAYFEMTQDGLDGLSKRCEDTGWNAALDAVLEILKREGE